MRVAFISRNTLFTGKGGDTIQILNTAKYLRLLGVEVDIYKSSEKIKYQDYDIIHGFNVIRPADLITHFENFEGIKVLSPIYVDYSEYEIKARGGLAGFIFRIVGSDFSEYLKTIMRRIKNGEKSFNLKYLFLGHRRTLKRLLALSDILLPNSASEYRRLYSKYGIAKQSKVIPNSIDSQIFNTPGTFIERQQNLVICVARIDGLKNQLNLIHALNNSRFELILIGKPAPNHLWYYEKCKQEAGPNVTFIQEMSQEELIKYYRRAKVHAMPSWFETTGLSSLEAVAMGCNIVITDKGDQREYFGSNAFYCEPDDIKGIFNAVSMAAGADANEEFKSQILKVNTWEQTAQKTLAAYHECIENKKKFDHLKRRKILFVVQLPPPIHGVSVMNQLIKESGLINSLFDCDFVDLATARSIEDLQKNRFSKYLHTLKIIFSVIAKMVVRRYDYVYVTIFPYGFSFIKDSLIVLISKFLNQKPILHLHTYGFKKSAATSALRTRYYKYVFRNVEVICLSALLYEDIEEIFKGRVYILPNGIPQVNFKNNYKVDQDPVNILFLSNLIKGKGILILLDALKIVKDRGIVFCFRVVGPENDISYELLRGLVTSKGLQNEVMLVGPKFNEDKYAEFKNAGIFILPTDYDTFGLVLLEAMQFGLPCISTNIGAIPDLLGGGVGIIVPEINAIELAKAIESLILDPAKRKDMSERGFDHFEHNFTKEIFEQRLANILNGRPDKIETYL